jgi:outer membrane receptor for ferrienterochelin and colicins
MRSMYWLSLSVVPVSIVPASGALADQMLPEISVSAKVSDLEDRRAAVTQKTIIDRQGNAATGGLTVGEVLGKLPGVDAGLPSSDGTAALRSRGMARDSVQVLVDGERPSGNSRHALLIISRMPAGELERVEIMKGATAEFGNATPVTINLVTNRTKRKESLDFKIVAGLRDDEPGAQLSITKEGNSGAWSWSIPLSLSQTRSPVDRTASRQEAAAGTRTLWQNEDERGRNNFSEQYFAPKLSWKEGKSSFSIWPMLFFAQGDRETMLHRTQYVDPVNGTSLGSVLQRKDAEETRYRINRLRLEGETVAAGTRFSGRLTLARGAKDSDIVRDSVGPQSTESYRRRENEVNAALRADRGWGDHLSSLGLEYTTLDRKERQEYTGAFVNGDTFDAGETQGALWVQDEWAVTKSVTLTSGLRAESISIEADSPSQRHRWISPSIATRWEVDSGWVLRSSIGAGIKAPKLDEISDAPIRSSGLNSPLEPDLRGNPELRPEKNVSVELALEHYWPNEVAVVGANVYVRDTKDFIERRPVLENSRWVERPYNEGDARHWGIELDAKLKTDSLGMPGGAFRTHLTLPHGRVDDRRLGIDRAAREVPRYVWSLGYDQSLPKWSSSAGFLLQQTGATRTDIPAEQWAETRARSVLDAYWVRKVAPTINLRLTLQNILGEDTRRTVRAYSAGQEWQLASMQNQPRAILVSLEGKW